MTWGQAPPSPGLVPQRAGLYDSKLSCPRDDWVLRGSPSGFMVLWRGKLGSPRSRCWRVWWYLLRTQFLVCTWLPSCCVLTEKETYCLSYNDPKSHRQMRLAGYSECVCVCMRAQLLQSCLTLCDPMNCHLPGSLSMGFSWQEYWSGLPFPSPGHSDDTEDNTFVLSKPRLPHPHCI